MFVSNLVNLRKENEKYFSTFNQNDDKIDLIEINMKNERNKAILFNLKSINTHI